MAFLQREHEMMNMRYISKGFYFCESLLLSIKDLDDSSCL